MKILGLDPGLQRTGWGLISSVGSSLTFIECGTIAPNVKLPMANRLAYLDYELCELIKRLSPDEAAVEETFMNNNAASALKLGQARGITLCAPARMGIPVAEYAANLVKKSVVGAGHADKAQIAAMVKILLPKSGVGGADEADALAVAICHAHHAASRNFVSAQAGAR